MKNFSGLVLSLVLASAAPIASAVPVTIGNPTDALYGCDPDIGFNCTGDWGR